MSSKIALVAGASGLVGRRTMERILTETDWHVVAMARRPRESTQRVTWLQADLRDAVACRAALRRGPEPTHLFYTARFDHPEGVLEDVAVNTAMLENLVAALHPVRSLRHVHAVHGTKYYGHNLHPVALPLSENSPRTGTPNFYFNQEDFLRRASREQGWSFSTSRPHAYCDLTVDHPRSIGLVFAIYGVIRRELGKPFDFPGTELAFRSRTQFTDHALLSRAILHIVQHPDTAGRAFDVVNGDNPTWEEIWSWYARWLGIAPGVARPMRLSEYMADKADVWRRITARYELRDTALHDVALWAYGDYQIRPQWDVFSASDALRSIGFTERVDIAQMFREQFDTYVAERIIPPLRGA
jgi:nucleoside-diphosphate-sugar epimerase